MVVTVYQRADGAVSAPVDDDEVARRSGVGYNPAVEAGGFHGGAGSDGEEPRGWERVGVGRDREEGVGEVLGGGGLRDQLIKWGGISKI